MLNNHKSSTFITRYITDFIFYNNLRYSEAAFVKLLEEKGIGRPSTYVPTISTLISRKYVDREKKILIPTELGFIVNDILSNYFKQIVDTDFTAEMEVKLDNVEAGKESWTHIVDEFFTPLKEDIEKAEKEISKRWLSKMLFTFN